ncbi:MAG: hypothetical protein JXA37_12880 [Chloroflexia bacterium]|nr:hypothetical protein [Chloroflexia bacterium]
MKHWSLFVLLVLLCGTLLGALAWAQAGEAQGDPHWYVVEAGSASGGGYRLAGQSWHVDGPVSAVGYLLEGPNRPFQGAGCCCAFLPCVFENANP